MNDKTKPSEKPKLDDKPEQKTEQERAAIERSRVQATANPKLTNEEATPGTGMLPPLEGDTDEANIQPSS